MRSAMHHLAAGIVAVAMGGSVLAGPLPEWAKLYNDGTLAMPPGVSASGIAHFGPDWQGMTVQDPTVVTAQQGYPMTADGQIRFMGRMVIGQEPSGFDLKVSLEPDAEGGFRYRAMVRNATPVPTGELALVIPLSGASGRSFTLLNGIENHVLPELFNESTWQKGTGGDVSFTLTDGRLLRIKGGKNLLIQDNRKYGTDTVSLRFRFEPSEGDIGEASIDLHITLQ